MPSRSCTTFGWLAVPLLTVGLLAATDLRAQDYDADMDNTPHVVKPGEITMKDVLAAHKAQQESMQNQALQLAPIGTTQSTLMAPNTGQSSVNQMMMQGLKNALQQSNTATSAPLVPSVVKAGIADNALAPAVPAAMPATTTTAAPDIIYQPGMAPKNLGSATSAPMAIGPVTASQTPAAPVANMDAEASAGSSGTTGTGACEAHSESYTKTCVEAGYPDNFVGEIKGETRTTCPSGALQNVWITNTCSSPDSANQAATGMNPPLTAPDNQMVPTSVGGEPVPAVAAAAPQTFSDNGDASCGPTNGLAAASRPVNDLCNAGTATDVMGDGPWRWSCKGTHGGMTVSCAAPVSPRPAPVETPSAPPNVTPTADSTAYSAPATVVEDGACGSSDSTVSDSAPATNLCNKGLASHVNGTGPWTWACSGLNGGQAVSCSASRRVDGACGTSNNSMANEMPMANLCDAGYASAVTGNGPWNWTCSGLYGGQAAVCSAAPRQDAVCGDATLEGHRDAPREDLCSVGQVSSLTGAGPWNWTCTGANGGASVSCEAPIAVSGNCGTANGTAIAQAPSENLCAKGSASRVTGVGPWQWNCSGSNGGDTESCTAPLASGAQPMAMVPASGAQTAAGSVPTASPITSTNTACGAASELAALSAPSTDLCRTGTASDVSGNGPWTWTCLEGSQKTECSTLSPGGSFETAAATASTRSAETGNSSTIMPAPAAAPTAAVVAEEAKAACGIAATQGLSRAPIDNLCSTGKASKVSGAGPWDWTCTKAKSHVACEAQPLVSGACGAANGAVQSATPTAGLCSAGSPTPIQGYGPWLWSCVGTGGGASISCSAPAQSKTRVDGACGAATNALNPSAPTTALCDGGVASNVYGDGPWTWTCSGLNGGVAASCMAQRNTPAAPPAPGPSVNGLCGSANGAAMIVQPMDNLCSSGVTTAVSGNGPWNWNCLGENGGMTVSCTSPLQPPAPITGACGQATGVPTLVPPRSALCGAGITSAVSGQGPWTWSCSGTNGGGAVACVAPLAGAGGVGSLPSLVTAPVPSSQIGGEAPAPMAAPAAPVRATRASGLVTPRLPSGSLPPLDTGTMPNPQPSPAFDTLPTPIVQPTGASDAGVEAPVAPDLPPGTQPLTPPAVRDTIPPTPALKATGFDAQGNLLAGNHFVFPDELSTVPFEPHAENFAVAEAEKLDQIAVILKQNPTVRITLTAYANVDPTLGPRDARRLSLTRALAIRDYLTSKGVSSSRIDVRALGANVFSGDYDRVDVKAN